MERVVRAACPHDCPDTCAMLVTVDAWGRATDLRGDPEHPVTAGFLCGKVSNYLERVYSEERILHPFVRVGAKGEGRFRQASWDEALDEAARRIRPVLERDSDRFACFVTSRGVTNETYYALQKTVRLLGTNNVDNSARLCHAPSTAVLKSMLGATGALIGFGAVMTREQVDMISAWQNGRIDEAKALGRRVQRLADVVFERPVGNYRVRLKECLRILGVLEQAHVRKPLLPIDDAERAHLSEVLEEVGLVESRTGVLARH